MSGPRTLRDELDDEPIVVPGTVRSDDVVISWSDHRLRIVRASLTGPERRVALGPGELGVVQVSRARRAGAEGEAPQDFVDIELRGGRSGRLRLSAPADPALLEGLPWYDAPGIPVELSAVRGVIAAARAMGARVTSHGSEVAIAAALDGGAPPARIGEAQGERYRIGPLMLHELPGRIVVDRSGYPIHTRNLALFASAMIAAATLVMFSLSSGVWLGIGASAIGVLWLVRGQRVAAHRRRPFRIEATIGATPTLRVENEGGAVELPASQIRSIISRRVPEGPGGALVAEVIVETHDGDEIAVLGLGRYEEPEHCAALALGLNALVLGQSPREAFLAAVQRTRPALVLPPG